MTNVTEHGPENRIASSPATRIVAPRGDNDLTAGEIEAHLKALYEIREQTDDAIDFWRTKRIVRAILETE